MIEVDKLIHDLKKFADWEPPESPRSQAMRDAAEALAAAKRIVAAVDNEAAALDDDKLMAKSYRIDTRDDDEQLRMIMFRDRRQANPLGYLPLESAEVYDLGTNLLKHFDRMEGIK